eukprot:TRINITY_DN18520_c0_g1_i1.p1 TRINITY_DN18520_c0_g1~~TRINITY_DN18520_c0_g1_i1.p1  ORF type:complete len:284 (-),score=42.18 TRINITY_DN18520_c0_g1_i1:17-820(-)
MPQNGSSTGRVDKRSRTGRVDKRCRPGRIRTDKRSRTGRVDKRCRPGRIRTDKRCRTSSKRARADSCASEPAPSAAPCTPPCRSTMHSTMSPAMKPFAPVAKPAGSRLETAPMAKLAEPTLDMAPMARRAEPGVVLMPFGRQSREVSKCSLTDQEVLELFAMDEADRASKDFRLHNMNQELNSVLAVCEQLEVKLAVHDAQVAARERALEDAQDAQLAAGESDQEDMPTSWNRFFEGGSDLIDLELGDDEGYESDFVCDRLYPKKRP